MARTRNYTNTNAGMKNAICPQRRRAGWEKTAIHDGNFQAMKGTAERTLSEHELRQGEF